MGDGGGGHCLVRMQWRPAGWSVCLPLLIFPCTIKSRSSLLAPAHPGGPGKRAVKRLWWYVVIATKPMHRLQIRPIVHNQRALSTIPSSYIRIRAVLWECGEGQTHRHTDGHRRSWPLYTSHFLQFTRNVIIKGRHITAEEALRFSLWGSAQAAHNNKTCSAAHALWHTYTQVLFNQPSVLSYFRPERATKRQAYQINCLDASPVTQLAMVLKVLTPHRENHPVTSSFLHPPQDSGAKGHNFLYDSSLMAIRSTVLV